MTTIPASKFAKLMSIESLHAAAIEQEEVLTELINESLGLFNSAPSEKLRLNEQLEYTNYVLQNTMGPLLNKLNRTHTNWIATKAMGAPNKGLYSLCYNAKKIFRHRLEIGETLITEYKNLRNDLLNNIRNI